VPHDQIALHFRPPQVDVAIFQPQFFVLVASSKAKAGGSFESLHQPLSDDLNLAGRHLGIDDVFCRQPLPQPAATTYSAAPAHPWRGLALVSRSEPPGLRRCGRAGQKDQVAVVAAAVDPAHQYHGLAGVLCAEFAAGMRTFECS
jgi:hypothetical protein